MGINHKKLAAFQKKHNIEVGKVKVIKPGFDRVHTGSYMLDLLWAGGLPKGRLCQFWGKPAHGKSSMAYICIAEALKRGESVLLIDKEYSRDPNHAKGLGVDIDGDLDITQPDNGDQAFDLVTYVLGEKIYDLIVVDSIASCKPKRHIEGSASDANVGISAKATATAAEMRTPLARESGTTILGLNQFRSGIGPFAKDYYPGGHNRAHNLMQSARFNAPKVIGDDEGIELNIKRDKLKGARIIKEAEIRINFGEGIDKAFDVISACVALGIVKQNGAIYTVNLNGEEVKVKGKAKLADKVEELEPILKECMARLRETGSPFIES